jgi:hypothetical protein
MWRFIRELGSRSGKFLFVLPGLLLTVVVAMLYLHDRRYRFEVREQRQELAVLRHAIADLSSRVSKPGREALLRAYTAEPIVLQSFDENPVTLDNDALTPGFRDTSAKQRMPCPAARPDVAVLLIAGQSNAANYAASKLEASPNVANLSLYDGECYRAADPLIGASATEGSFATILGDELLATGLYKSVVLVPIAIGATHIRQWTPDGTLHRRLLVALGRAQQKRLPITHFLWQQGEADIVLANGDMYKHMFEDIFVSLRQHGMLAPIYLAQATHCGLESALIREAQRSLVDPRRGILAGPNTDTLGDEFRRDTCHFSAEGVRRQASMWVQALSMDR